MTHPESSSSAPLPSPEQREAMHNPYARINTKNRKQVPQELTELFRELIKFAVFRCALPKQSPRACVEQFLERVHQTTPFRFNITGSDALEDAEIIFANHQGPRVDEEQASQATECASEQSAVKMGRGGSECLYSHAVIPPRTRFVLKKYLVQVRAPLHGLATALVHGQWKKAKQELERIIKALAFLKTRPITVDRTLTKPAHYTAPPDLSKEKRRKRREPWREYAKTMRRERERTAEEITAAIHEGETLIVYPEGTRSPDGQILGFVSEYFENIVSQYIIPRMMDGKGIRISILVADTLRTFPHGVGRNVPAYDAPISLHGIHYNPSQILNALRIRGEEAKPFDKKDLQNFGRMLLMDIRNAMSRTLQEIVTTADEISDE